MRSFNNFYNKKNLKIRKKNKNSVVVEHHNLDWDKKFHERKVFINPFKDHIKEGSIWKRSFHLPLYFGWEVVFTLQKIGNFSKQIVGPFKSYKGFITAVVLLIFIFSSVFFFTQNTGVQAFTFYWQQSSWAGGQTANDANHTDNRTNWTEYSAKDTNIAASTTITLTEGAGSLTETSDTDFNAGTTSATNTDVRNSLDHAYVKLAVDTVNNPAGNGDANAVASIAYIEDYGVFVAINNSPILKKYSTSTHELLATYTFGSDHSYAHKSMVRQPGTNILWLAVAKGGDIYLSKFNMDTGVELNSYYINPNNSVKGMVWDSSTSSLWMADYSGQQVIKIDSTDGSVTGSYAVGGNIFDLTFDSSTNSIWALDYTNDKVRKFSAADGSVTGTYGVGDAPKGIVFDPSTNSIWVANTNARTITKLLAADGSVTGTYTPNNVAAMFGLAFDENNNYIIAVGSLKLSRILASDGSEVDQENISNAASSMSFDPSSDTLFLGNFLENFDFIPFSGSLEYEQHIDLGVATHSALFDPSSNSLWFSDTGTDNLRQLNLDTNSIINTYSIPNSSITDMAWDSVNETIWAANRDDDTVMKIDPSDGSILGTYSVGDRPESILFDPASESIWVANANDETVTQLSATDGSLIGSHTYGIIINNSLPDLLEYDPFTESVWLAHDTGIIKINPNTGSSVATTTFTGGGYGLAFDSYTNSIWVTDAGYNKVRKIDPSDGSILGTYSASDRSKAVEFDPITNTLWLTNTDDDNFTMIDVTDGSIKGYFATGAGDSYMGIFDPYTNSMWSVNSGILHKIKIGWYASSGTFTSQILDTSGNSGFGNMSWSSTTPAGTALTMKIRSSNDAGMAGATVWTSCSTITSGNDITGDCVTDGHQYIQYQAAMTTNTGFYSPILKDVTIEFLGYTNGTLTSSSYDGRDATNIVNDISWTESGTGEIKFQIRTSGNNSTWSDWLGPTSTSDYYSTAAGGHTINSTHTDQTNDRYVQYKAFIKSTDGLNTPTLSNTTLTYVVNGAPDYDSGNPSAAAQKTSDGKVTIDYWIRDVDNNSVTPSFEYTLNGNDPSPSWGTITSGYLAAGDTSSKSVDNVTYTKYTAIWSAKDHIDGEYSEETKIRITANDGEIANYEGISTTAAFTLDVTNPNLGGEPILIDATTTPATITLSATDNSGLEFKISLASDLTGANWQTYTTGTTISLQTDPETVYVQFRDSVKNTSTIQSETSPDTPDRISTDDISNAATSAWRTFIIWSISDLQVSDFAYYRIYYSTDNITYSLLFSENDKTKNYYLHDGLTQNQIYYYKIFVEKNNDTKSGYTNVVNATPTGQGGTDSASPTITNVASGNISTQSATITWDTEELSDSIVSYSTTSGSFTSEVSVASMVDNASNYGPHEVVLTGLETGTTYYYQVTSADPIANSATDNNGGGGYSFTTLSGPTISLVTPSNVTNFTATISWITNLSTDTTINYSTNSDLSDPIQIHIDNAVTEHSITLSNLTTATKYYYYVESSTALDNNAGRYYTFYTTSDSISPTISAQSVVIITDSKAVAQWSTNEPSTTSISYGTTSGDLTEIQTDTSLNYLHLLILSDLTPDTTYYYKVTSVDASGNSATSTESTFQTLSSDTDPQTLEELNDSIIKLFNSEDGSVTSDQIESSLDKLINSISGKIPSPIIQGEPRVDELSTTATISWATDKEANATILYSSEETFNVSTIRPYEHSQGDTSEYNTTHSITITNLLPSTIYHFQVKSKGKYSSESVSADYTFTTQKKSFGIENYSVEKLTNEKAVFGWVTTEKANTVLSYTPYRYNVLAVDEKSVITDDNLNLIHQIEIDTFESGVIYLIELQSVDENDNISVVTIETFTTNEENAAPLITQIQTDSALSPGGQAKVQTIISWKTNEPATSKIFYQQGVGEIDTTTAESTQIDKNYTKDHVVIITTFESGSVYQFQVESTDSSGLVSLSSPITILTPQEEQTVFEVIFGAVEDAFGWLKVFSR